MDLENQKKIFAIIEKIKDKEDKEYILQSNSNLGYLEKSRIVSTSAGYSKALNDFMGEFNKVNN